MKKSPIVFTLCALVTVPMVLLTVSIRENKAEQKAIEAVPAIKDGETRASEWGKLYPRQYDTYMQTRKSDKIVSVKTTASFNPHRTMSYCGRLEHQPRRSHREHHHSYRSTGEA